MPQDSLKNRIMPHETDSFHLDQYKMFSEILSASGVRQRILDCLAVEAIHVTVFSVLHNSKDLPPHRQSSKEEEKHYSLE